MSVSFGHPLGYLLTLSKPVAESSLEEVLSVLVVLVGHDAADDELLGRAAIGPSDDDVSTLGVSVNTVSLHLLRAEHGHGLGVLGRLALGVHLTARLSDGLAVLLSLDLDDGTLQVVFVLESTVHEGDTVDALLAVLQLHADLGVGLALGGPAGAALTVVSSVEIVVTRRRRVALLEVAEEAGSTQQVGSRMVLLGTVVGSLAGRRGSSRTERKLITLNPVPHVEALIADGLGQSLHVERVPVSDGVSTVVDEVNVGVTESELSAVLLVLFGHIVDAGGANVSLLVSRVVSSGTLGAHEAGDLIAVAVLGSTLPRLAVPSVEDALVTSEVNDVPGGITSRVVDGIAHLGVGLARLLAGRSDLAASLEILGLVLVTTRGNTVHLHAAALELSGNVPVRE